jgi:hypothetical protein
MPPKRKLAATTTAKTTASTANDATNTNNNGTRKSKRIKAVAAAAALPPSATPEPETVTLNSHIMYDLLPYLDNQTLIAVRATCRRFRDLCSVRLGRHITIRIVRPHNEISPVLAIRTRTSGLPGFRPRAYPILHPEEDAYRKRLHADETKRAYPYNPARPRKLNHIWDETGKKAGWSGRYVAHPDQWDKLEKARIELAKVENAIADELMDDIAKRITTNLKEYKKNEEGITQMLKCARSVTFLSMDVDLSGLVGLMQTSPPCASPTNPTTVTGATPCPSSRRPRPPSRPDCPAPSASQVRWPDTSSQASLMAKGIPACSVTASMAVSSRSGLGSSSSLHNFQISGLPRSSQRAVWTSGPSWSPTSPGSPGTIGWGAPVHKRGSLAFSQRALGHRMRS